MSIIISAKNISKTYPKINTAGNRFKALISLLFNKKITDCSVILQDINLEIKRGESLAIIGKNGAGKSTLLKIISGVINATTGSVSVKGKIGALLELGSGFHPEYTGRENLKMSAALAGMNQKEIAQNLEKMIAFADIGEYIDQPVKNYSSGMVVRLGFSVVTVTNPELLITDEVLAVGDTDFQRKCIAWIDNYLTNGGTLLLVSHSLYHVQKLCKHAIWIESGKIKMQGGSFEVSQEYQSFYERKVETKSDTIKDLTNYHIKNFAILNKDGIAIKMTETHSDITVKIQLHSPDNRPPGVSLGIVKKDIPVYGTFSDLQKATPVKLEDKLFEYTICLPDIKLLPADYTFRAHAMDPECIRLIDTIELPVRIYSQSQEMGIVQLETKWN